MSSVYVCATDLGLRFVRFVKPGGGQSFEEEGLKASTSTGEEVRVSVIHTAVTG
jgi:hypothetical protein